MNSFPLSAARPGDRLRLDEVAGSLGTYRCRRTGLKAGMFVRAVSVRASGSVVLAIESDSERHIGFGAAVAQQIWVSRPPQSRAPEARSKVTS